ncbi:Type VI secretion system effector, Hcp [Frankineae bacterium MT45]|nr:Type VI secretion system effector, Hcp [Frankineae bacterium MT45]
MSVVTNAGSSSGNSTGGSGDGGGRGGGHGKAAQPPPAIAVQHCAVEPLGSNMIGMRALIEALGIDAAEDLAPSTPRPGLALDAQLRCELGLGRRSGAGSSNGGEPAGLESIDLDLHQYSWGEGLIAPSMALATPITVPHGSGEFVLVAAPSAASPVLFGAMITGEVFDRVVVTVSRATPGACDVDFLRIELSAAMVCGFHEFGVGTASILETTTLTYAQLRYVYYPQNADGSYGVPAMGRWSRRPS